MRRTRGLLLWALLGALLGFFLWRRRSVAGVEPVDGSWPPMPRPVEAVERWVEPVGGQAPDSHPIKAGASGIYHVPGGRSYDRTTATRCYATAEDAEADGYRRAKA